MLRPTATVVPLVLCALLIDPARAEPPATAPTRIERLSDLLDADLRNSKLHVEMLAGKTGEGSLLVTDTHDEWTWQRRDPLGPIERFVAWSDDREQDRWSALHLYRVECDELALRIAGIGRSGNSFVNVTLVQDVSGVELLVQRARRGRARPLDGASAESIVRLWNDHQPQVRRYLLPLLDEMSQRSVMRPRGGDVYRVFDRLPADPLVVEALRALLPQLDAVDAVERDAATAKLDALGEAGVLAAMRMDLSQLSPEQRGRLTALIERNTLWRDPAVARDDPHFLVDCLDHEDREVRAEALAALRALVGREIEFDASAPLGARRAAAAEIIEILEETEAQPAAGE